MNDDKDYSYLDEDDLPSVAYKQYKSAANDFVRSGHFVPATVAFAFIAAMVGGLWYMIATQPLSQPKPTYYYTEACQQSCLARRHVITHVEYMECWEGCTKLPSAAGGRP